MHDIGRVQELEADEDVVDQGGSLVLTNFEVLIVQKNIEVKIKMLHDQVYLSQLFEICFCFLVDKCIK